MDQSLGVGDQPERKKKRWILWLLLLLLLAAIAIGIYFFLNKDDPQSVHSRDLMPAIRDADDRSTAEIAQELADANYFTLMINPTVTFSDGKSHGNLGIINPATNVYPIAVEIKLDDTEELIYSSGGVLPNQEILEARLDKPLSKGNYEATATVKIYDPETKEQQGVTQAAIKITVEK